MRKLSSDSMEKITEIMDAEVYRHSSWGMAVVDLETGESLLDIHGDKLFVPASTTKLWTCAAALDVFGPDHRFVTPIYQRGEVNPDGVLQGELILRAVGDPNLSGRLDSQGRLAFTHPDHTLADYFDSAPLQDTDPLDGIDDLVRQVAGNGIRRVIDVIVDDRLFNRKDPNYHEPVPPSAVMVNDNIIDLVITPGERLGEPAEIEVRPQTAYVQIDALVETVKPGAGNQVQVQRLTSQKFTVRGQIELGRAPLVKVAWIEEPQDLVRTLLIERLEAHGVRVERSRLLPNDPGELPEIPAYDQLPILARHTSPPFSETLRVVLKLSHNTIADVLPMLLASQKGEGSMLAGLQILGEFQRSIGIEAGSVVLMDGSGGSPSNHVTPRATLKLLQTMAARSDYPAYLDALPVLGIDGTLADAVKPDSPVRGKVRAKTGTYIGENGLDGSYLLNSKALAGYMTASSGSNLAFAIFLNRVPLSSISAVMQQGQVLGSLCEILYRGL